MYLAEVHPRPDEAKRLIAVLPKKGKYKWSDGLCPNYKYAPPPAQEMSVPQVFRWT